jgi:pimeloyl-ACP methyl ester carboxylesterase
MNRSTVQQKSRQTSAAAGTLGQTSTYKKFVAIVATGILAIGLATSSVQAQEAQHVTVRPTVILVHGAWADGSSWSKVIPLLKAKGFAVVAVQLPLSSFAEDVAVVKRAIALETGPVLLVGHSYGGVVITQVGDDEKVAGLVYVAAFVPDISQNAGDLIAKGAKTPINAELRPDAQGFLKITPQGIEDDFAQDLTPVEKSTLAITQHPTSASVLGTPVTTAAWHTKPSWFIVAEEDRVIDPALERSMAATIHAKTSEVKSSHVVMLSKPDFVAHVIEDAAQAHPSH